MCNMVATMVIEGGGKYVMVCFRALSFGFVSLWGEKRRLSVIRRRPPSRLKSRHLSFLRRVEPTMIIGFNNDFTYSSVVLNFSGPKR